MSATIYQLPMQVPGMVGVLPNPKFMVVGDNLATLTTAGYLNQVNLESNPIANTDVIQCLYSFVPSTQVGTYGVFAVTISNGVITLTLEGAAGEVTLPTIANHIATFTNVSGGISEDPATAISGGNIQAGLSGTAGYLASFPATSAKGSLHITGVANTGNTVTTISNAAMGQASVVSIPDPGTSTADFVVAPAALISGNFLKASGTAGLVVDSGVASSPAAGVVGVPYVATVTMSTAQVNGAYAAPVVIIPAPGASVAIVILNAQIVTEVSTAFAAGGVAQLQYAATANAGGTLATSATIAAVEITAATSQIFTQAPIAAAAVLATATYKNLGIYFTNATQPFTTGTGSTVTAIVTYVLVPAV